MTFLMLCLGAAVAWYLVSQAIQQSKPNGGQKHCMTCGSDAVPLVKTKGSIFIELILWLCFLVPGLIYSIWRLNTRGEACPHCSGVLLVPTDSPAALAHKKQLQA